MKYYQIIFIVAISAATLGCGEEKIYLSIDSNSIDRIVSKMSPEEALNFLGDVELITKLRGNPYAINGYTVAQVREEAAIGRRYVAEKNGEFIGSLIQQMIKTGTKTAKLLQNSAGIYTPPEPGYITNSYLINDLKIIYKENGGDLAALEASVQQTINTENIAQSRQAATQQDKFYCENRLSDDEAEKTWAYMSTDKNAYLAQCNVAESEVAVRLGGMSIEQARQHAKGTCDATLADTYRCMVKAGAVAADCICGADE